MCECTEPILIDDHTLNNGENAQKADFTNTCTKSASEL